MDSGVKIQRVLRVGLYFLLIGEGAFAANEPTETTPPPAVNEGEVKAEVIEPEVRIINQQGNTVEEFRTQGRLYMVKITPSKGYPYYLVDSDGDGKLETRRNDLDPDIVVPRWTIFSWP